MAKKVQETCRRCGDETWCEIRISTGAPQCMACKVELFFDRVLYAPKGLRLLDWQREYLRTLYGTLHNGTELRRYRRSYGQFAKKQGKSFLVGGLPIYHMVCEDELRQEAYGCAAAKDQAGIVFRSAAHLVRGNTMLTDRLKVNESTKRILRRDGNGFYAVISADGDIQDGIEPSLAIRDELHRWKTQKAETLGDVISKGMISRREPLDVGITTAGEIADSPICWREYENAQMVLNGTLSMPRFYPVIYAADEKRVAREPNYWKSKEARVAANPSHEDNGGFLRDEAIVEELDKALAQPSEKNKYLRYHLNIWVQNETAAIELADWDQGNVELGRLVERPCYLGGDLSLSTDLSALVALFPPVDEGGFWDVKPFFWMPEKAVHERKRIDRVPYDQWIENELIEASVGEAVDYRQVKARIKWAAECFDLREIVWDPWNSREISMSLADEGFTCVELRQGFGSLSEPTKKVLELVKAGKLRHAGHPVLRWMAGCVTTKSDGNDNIRFVKPDRAKSSKRIDGMAALVNAMARAMVAEPVGSPFWVAA